MIFIRHLINIILLCGYKPESVDLRFEGAPRQQGGIQAERFQRKCTPVQCILDWELPGDRP